MELDFPELASVLRQACANGLEVDHRVMARNLLCDSHRTPVERMRVFLEESGDVSTTKELQKALYQYRWRHVCPPRVRPGEPKVQPVYARAENGANAITQDVEMVATVLNLSWMGQIYAAARSDFKIPEFERFELANPEDVDEINQKLGDQLSEKNLREPFLAAILKARNRYESGMEIARKISAAQESIKLDASGRCGHRNPRVGCSIVLPGAPDCEAHCSLPSHAIGCRLVSPSFSIPSSVGRRKRRLLNVPGPQE